MQKARNWRFLGPTDAARGDRVQAGTTLIAETSGISASSVEVSENPVFRY
jgi:hypothetical protein